MAGKQKPLIKLDKKNANRGTERGRDLLEKSLADLGAGRSILLDKDGNVIAGNKTYEAAEKLGLPVKVVETDGAELVAVKRTDLDLAEDAGKARQLAIMDNRAGELDLEWDHEKLIEALDAGVDLQELGFTDDELARLASSDDEPPGDDDEEYAPGAVIQYTIVFDNVEQQDAFFGLLRHLKENYEGETLGERFQAFARDVVDAN